MSVISIRPAQESLRNLGSTRMPDRMPNLIPAERMNANRAIVPNAVGDLAHAIQRGGAQVLSAAFAYGQLVQDEKDRILLADAGAEYQKRLLEGMMNPDGGLLVKQGENAVGTGKAAESLMGDTFKEVCEEKKITGRLKELFRMHVNPVDQSWRGRTAYHEASETMKWRSRSAEDNAQKSRETWQETQFAPTLDPNANAGMAKKLLDDYERDRECAGDDKTTLRANVRKYAQGLASDMILGAMSRCKTEDDFDRHIKQLEENPEKFIEANAAIDAELRGPNAPKVDGKTAPALLKKTIDLLIAEAKLKKDQLVRSETKAMNDEVDALIAAGGEAEAQAQMGQGVNRSKALYDMDTQIKALQEKGKNLPEGSKVRTAAYQAAARLDKSADNFAEHLMISDYLEAQKVDPNYRLYTPEERKDGKVVKKAFNRYEGDPRREKLCEKVQNMIDKESLKRTDAEREANREALSRSLNRLNALKLEGSISQEEASLTQAAIWSKYRTCLIAGSLPDGFERTFASSIQSMLSEQEANAMRKFYKAFGYAPNLKSDGEVAASDRNAARKDSTDYYAPLEDNGQRVESRKTRVRAYELLEYGDALLKTLRTKSPDIDREALVDGEISRLKSEWIKGEFKKNIAATMDAVQKSTIQFKGRMGAAREGNGQKQKDTERKERRDDDSDSK